MCAAWWIVEDESGDGGERVAAGAEGVDEFWERGDGLGAGAAGVVHEPPQKRPSSQGSVDAIGAVEVAHFLLARFCLIRSACARRIPAARARRMPGPRP